MSAFAGPAYDINFSEVRDHSLIVLWKAPVYTGQSPVTGYILEMAKKGSSEFVKLTEEPIAHRYFKVKGLFHDATETCRVLSR